MELAGYRVDPVLDGEGTLRPAEAFPEVPRPAWRRHADLLDDDGLLPHAVGALLLRGHGRTALVDLGYGRGTLGELVTGRLLEGLEALAVGPGDVTDVLFTHLHRDHVGWARIGGVTTLPKAVLHCDDADWEHFVRRRADSEVAERLAPYEGRIAVYGDDDVLPGITPRPAPGHTPGSTVLEVGERELVVLGDVVHAPVQLLEPTWRTPWDVDPRLAQRTRDAVLADVAADPSVLLVGMHFPGLRPGRIVGSDAGRRWVL